MTAYARYLQYVQVLNYQAAHPSAGADAAQYFTNGASITTIPASGPGSAYFTNGAEVTALPPPLPTVAPAPATLPPLPNPRASTSASPWWWGETLPPAAQSAAPPPLPPPAPLAPPLAEPPAAAPAMSFDEWLQSMGAGPEEVADTRGPEEPALTTSDVDDDFGVGASRDRSRCPRAGIASSPPETRARRNPGGAERAEHRGFGGV